MTFVALKSNDSQNWRESLRKSEAPTFQFMQRMAERKQAMDKVSTRLYSYKGVSLTYLNRFWRAVRREDKFPRSELYEVINQQDERDPPIGSTVKKMKSGTRVQRHPSRTAMANEAAFSEKYWYAKYKKEVTLFPFQVRKKQRRVWSVQDLCDYGLYTEMSSLNAPLISAIETEMVGNHFQGVYVTYPRSCSFENLMLSLRDYVANRGSTPAEETFFWIDIFSMNVSAVETIENKRLITKDLLEQLNDYDKTSIKLFDNRFIFFDCWTDPTVLKELQYVHKIFQVFSVDQCFEVIVDTDIVDDFLKVYDNQEKDIFKTIENMDPTRLFCSGRKHREFYLKGLTSPTEGFSTVKQHLLSNFSKWFAKAVELDVKSFPVSSDQTEKFAMFLTKAGDFLRKRGELSVAKSYLLHALSLSDNLQGYIDIAIDFNSTFELTMGKQLEKDRVYGGACKIHLYLALIYIEESQFVQGEKHLELADLEARKLLTPRHAFLADVAEARALMCSKQGRRKKAMEELVGVGLILQDNLEVCAEKYCELQLKVAQKHKEAGEYTKTLQLLQKTRKSCLRFLGAEHILFANMTLMEASIEFREDHMKEARDLYQKALDIILVQIGEVNVLVAKTYSHIGQCYAKEKAYDSARENFEKSIEMFSFATGKFTFEIVTLLNFLGVVFKEEKDYNEAEQRLEEALAVSEEASQILDEKNVLLDRASQNKWNNLLANVHSNLGQTYVSNYKRVKAKKSLWISYTLTKQLLGEEANKTKNRYMRWKKLVV